VRRAVYDAAERRLLASRLGRSPVPDRSRPLVIVSAR
jgi:hypothetical protein